MEKLTHGDLLHARKKGLKSLGFSFLSKEKITHSALFLILKGVEIVVDVNEKDIIKISLFSDWSKKFIFSKSSPIWTVPETFALSLTGSKGFNYRKNYKKGSLRTEPLGDLISEEIVLAIFGRLNNSPTDLLNYCNIHNF